MLSKLILLVLLGVVPVNLIAQSKAAPTKQTDAAGVNELEAIIAETGKLDDKLAMVIVQSRAAMLVSFSDATRAETMFLGAWRFAKAQSDPDFDKENALNLILKCVFPRNPRLARRLLAEASDNNISDSSLQMRATGRDQSIQRMARLASHLIDGHPSVASALLERSLSTNVTPAGVGALLRLREKDPLLSDFVVTKVLDGLKTQPTVVSLAGLHMLTAYLFPEPSTFVPSTEFTLSLESLQFEYFFTTYDMLRASLAESEAALLREQRYTQTDLRFRSIFQGQIATVLAALAPRYQPNLAQELNELALRLSVQLPPNVAQLSQFTAARLSGNQATLQNPEAAIPFAISTGDFDGASKLIDDLQSEKMREIYAQTLTKIQAKALLAKSEVMGALSMIRNVEDQNARLVLYLEALRVTQKKRDASLSSIVLNEARILIPQVERNGLHVRALLTFARQLAVASPDEAVEFLNSAVVAINTLPKPTEQPSATKSPAELALAEINDVRSLLDSPELELAFSAIGAIDLERGIGEARKIRVKSVQLVARLAAIAEVIKRDSRRPKSKPATKTAAQTR